MKKLHKFILSALAVSMLAGASLSAVAGPDMIKQDRKMKGFKALSLRGPIDAVVKIGKKHSVVVTASEETLERVQTMVTKGTLTVKLEKGYYSSSDLGDITVYITVPTLTALKTHGSGDTVVSGTMKGKSLDLSIYGSGDIVVAEAKYDQIGMEIKGSGDMQIKDGQCDLIKASIKGSGDIVANGVICDEGSVNIKGSGDISLYAKKSVKANVYGSGDIDVYGNPPSVNARAMGSGEVKTHQ